MNDDDPKVDDGDESKTQCPCCLNHIKNKEAGKICLTCTKMSCNKCYTLFGMKCVLCQPGVSLGMREITDEDMEVLTKLEYKCDHPYCDHDKIYSHAEFLEHLAQI